MAMLQSTAGVECFVDVYPYEASSMTLTGGQILTLTTDKNIRANVGTFEFTLAPENVGNSSQLSWSQILTPMSFVVIGLRRGATSSVTMLGLITNIAEGQDWRVEDNVYRTVKVSGVDLAYYFMMADWYSLWFLGAGGGQSSDGPGIVAAGLLGGQPSDLGQKWYNLAMMQGVFKNTFVPYRNSQVLLDALFGTQFQAFATPVTSPAIGDYFVGANDSWMTKFRAIFPFPFYEFFVTTTVGISGVSAGKEISSVGLGSSVTSSAAVVARLNPLPMLQASAGGNLAPNITGIDVSKWTALPQFDLGGAGFLSSSIGFTESEVKNFYQINPIFLTGQNGDSNGNINQFLYGYAGMLDAASVNRYGYRPMSFDTTWLSDPGGVIAGSSNKRDMPNLMATLYAQLAGYYEADPLMAKAQVTTFLRSDIEIGTRFQYAPYKDGIDWMFYVLGVNHNYIFGGPSTTTLTLDRGLPSSVYGDSSLLLAIHKGNAQRVNGAYQAGLPAGSPPSLQALPTAAYSSFIGQLWTLYTKQQATQQPQ